MARTKNIYFECACTDITQDEWNRKMRGKRKISYKWLVDKIRKMCPEMVDTLMLDFYNPYQDATYSTREYYVITNSAIEYFFKKY